MGKRKWNKIAVLCLLIFWLCGAKITAAAAQTATAAIPVGVVLEGALPEGEEAFVIELTAQDSDAPMPVGSENGRFQMALTGESSGYIWLPCEKVGVFGYTVRQLPGENSACSYDERIYRVRILVTYAEGGGFGASVVVEDGNGGKLDRITFRNAYAGPASVIVRAVKLLDGGTPKDGRFLFRLLDESGEIVFQTENDGRHVTFPALRFQREGTYRYFLKEVRGNDPDIQYDRTVYTVTVVITKDNGSYQANVTYERNGKDYSGLPHFLNKTGNGNPKTGDTIVFYFSTMMLSGTALLLLSKRRKRYLQS